MNQLESKANSSRLLEIVKAIVILLFAGVAAYKIIITPIGLEMDFYALLSLLLALFSVGLSVLFYFKATDTSNAFYDNTYKFTKDIAELLVRIESGFGERLRHLDESYTRIQDRVYFQPSIEEIAEKQEQVKEEEENFNEKLQERNKIINDLVEQSRLDNKEKQRVLVQLKNREDELRRLQVELTKSKEQAEKINASRRNPITSFSKAELIALMGPYAIENVVGKIPATVWRSDNTDKLNEAWLHLIPQLNNNFLRDLQDVELVDSGLRLTDDGINFFKELALPSKRPKK